MPEGQRTGHKTEIPTLCESEAPVTGTIKTFNLGNLVDFKKLGKLAMEINNDKPNGLTDGSHLRRRRRSSGDSDLVVLSVVFNKKKQKQNDEVAIAIERLRENGVNCVLFTMNDFRNGSTKPDSATPDSICLSSSTPTSTNSFCQLGRENKDSTKLFSSLPMIPSIKCEVSENSNGSTDSNSSSNVAIHESVEKVINSFSPSPSPSPPPLSPQLLPTTSANSEQEFTSKSVMSMAASLHELLSPLLPDSQPPTLRHEVSVSANNKVEPTLQEIQICSSSSPGEYHSNPKRRRRRVRKPYTHRKAQLKKKLKIIADEAKAIRAAQRAAQARTETILPISDAVSISSCGNQEEISSSNDRLLPHPVESSLCTGNGNCGEEESNALISLTNFSSEDKIVKDDLIRNSNCATVTTVDSINAHEDETIIPDSSSSTIVHSTIPTCITVNKKRKRNGGIGRRKKKRNRLIQPVSNDLLKVGAFENMAKVNSACRNGFTKVNGNISVCDPTGSKSVVDRKPQVGSPLLLELVDGHVNGDDEDSMPLASLLKRKRAFSPDIIRGIRQNNSQKLSNMDVQKRFNHVDSLEASRPSCIPGSQKDDSVKREIVKITHCVQSEKISQVNQVQPNCASEEPNGFIDVFKDGRKKKKKRGGKLRLVVRKNMRLKKSSRKHFLATPNEQILESSQLGCNITEPNHLIQDIIQGESVITTVNGYQGLEPLREKGVKAEEALAKQPVGSSVEVFQIKEEACLGQDDDSVPSIDSGLPSSENASVSDDFKAENGSESSGCSSLDSQLKQPSDSLNSSGVFDPTNGSHDFGYLESAPGSFKRSEDSLPASPDGMQLRRSNFYFLISDNVRKNMENYLDGRMVTKVQTKRRKRTKNSYLLNHGDNYPNDPEAPYKLHMATQVLLKLNKRRAKCKPKEDRGRSLLSYLKLVPKRPPRTGKAALPSPKEEEPKETHEEPLFSGEWTIPRKYICHVCGQIESSFWDMVMHKGELHPGVLVTHTELTGQVPHSLVRTLSTTGNADDESIPSCSKCSATFSMTQDLHRHIFECAGNAVWLEEEKTPRKRKSKRRRGFKRRLSNTPKKTKKPDLPKRRPSEVFKCEFCPREFKTEGWLKNHLVSHSLPVSIPLEKLSLPSRASNNSTSARLFKT